MDEFDKMQERFRQLGLTHMLLKEPTPDEIAHLCQNLDARWMANETRLDIAMGKRADRRAKKAERRTGQPDTREDKAERRRQARR